MHVLVEASAAYNQGAGIGRYSRNILQRLIPLAADDRFTLLRAPEDQSVSRFDATHWPNAGLKTLPFNRRNADRVWFRLRLPLEARLFAGNADVVYSPDFTAPPMWRVPRMITVHDLAFLTRPTHTTDALRRYLEEVVPRQVQGADLVAAVSHATAVDLKRYYNVPDDKIVLARNAVDESFYRAQPLTDSDRARLGLPDRYFVMLGTIEPRKNHGLALAAIRRANLGMNMPLVIVGRFGWGHDTVAADMRSLQADELVIHIDNAADGDLPAILASSTAMIYPSWTEGFGLPVAESLATGIPVVTGIAPALREVGGDFARYVDPEDVDTLVEHMQELAETQPDPDIAAARSQWTRQFSWDSSTSTVYDALRRISR
jgi:glycosyltransferase involved in cell wall biosynthesis